MARPRTPEKRRSTAASVRRQTAARALAALVREHTPRAPLRQICRLLAEKELAEELTLADLVAAMDTTRRERAPASHGSSRRAPAPPDGSADLWDRPRTIDGVEVILAPLPRELRMPFPAPRVLEDPRLPAPVNSGPNLELSRMVFLSALNGASRELLDRLQRLGGWVTAPQLVESFNADQRGKGPPDIPISAEETLLRVEILLQRLVRRGDARRRRGRYIAVMTSCT